MVNGTLVVDAVVHAANATRENVAPAIEPMAEPLLEAAYGLHAVRRGRASPGRRSEARRLRVRSSDMAAHAQIYEALSAVYDTCSLFNRTNLNIVEMGLVHDVEQDGDTVRVRLLLTDPMCLYQFEMRAQIIEALAALPDVDVVHVEPVGASCGGLSE